MLEIPEAVLAAPVSAASKLVWAALQAAMKPGGVVYPAEALAAYLCLPREEVQAALKELTSAGIVQAEVSTGRILLVETEMRREAQVTVTDFEAAVEASKICPLGTGKPRRIRKGRVGWAHWG